jgi:hypothetical protein
MADLRLAPVSIERMAQAVDKVQQRLRRVTSALDAAGIPYAVAGGNAVAAWVTRVDQSAVRYTQDVDIVIRRADLDEVRRALEPLGFMYRHAASIDMFLDGPDAKARDAVHVLFAEEKVRPEYATAAPDPSECDASGEFRVLTLEALVIRFTCRISSASA